MFVVDIWTADKVRVNFNPTGSSMLLILLVVGLSGRAHFAVKIDFLFKVQHNR